TRRWPARSASAPTWRSSCRASSSGCSSARTACRRCGWRRSRSPVRRSTEMVTPTVGSENVTGTGLGAARETIAVLDYGGQYVQLIARRVRESRVYCEIFPHDASAADLIERRVIGVIPSGGPASEPDAH